MSDLQIAAYNVFQCSLCKGTVNRHGGGETPRLEDHYYFKCESCGAVGDKFTGHMVRLDPEYYREKYGE